MYDNPFNASLLKLVKLKNLFVNLDQPSAKRAIPMCSKGTYNGEEFVRGLGWGPMYFVMTRTDGTLN